MEFVPSWLAVCPSSATALWWNIQCPCKLLHTYGMQELWGNSRKTLAGFSLLWRVTSSVPWQRRVLCWLRSQALQLHKMWPSVLGSIPWTSWHVYVYAVQLATLNFLFIICLKFHKWRGTWRRPGKMRLSMWHHDLNMEGNYHVCLVLFWMFSHNWIAL